MEVLVIVLLTLLNGFFALAEISLVSSKRVKLEHLASRGQTKARELIKLLDSPENFLSSIQVGITLIGIISGAYGGATLTDNFEKNLHFLHGVPVLGGFVHEIALATVVGTITFFSIVIGELVPKTIAMNSPESVALVTVPVISTVTRFTYPVVWLLSQSTRLVVLVLGIREKAADRLSEDELRAMLKTASRQGVLETDESVVHQNLFSFNDQSAKSLMTHRTELEWIDLEQEAADLDRALRACTHSKIVVCEGGMENCLGTISVQEYLEKREEEGFSLRSIIRKPLFLTQHVSAFRILNLFRQNKQYLGIVVDEFGVVKGIVTLHDIFEALVGNLPEEDMDEDPSIVKRPDGTYLLEGQTLIFELNQHFQRELIPYNNARYTTVSGFMIDELKTIPNTGERMETEQFVLEVLDKDGARIDKLMLTFK